MITVNNIQEKKYDEVTKAYELLCKVKEIKSDNVRFNICVTDAELCFVYKSYYRNAYTL